MHTEANARWRVLGEIWSCPLTASLARYAGPKWADNLLESLSEVVKKICVTIRILMCCANKLLGCPAISNAA